MKTFIRRPGNKSKHLKHIIPLIPEFTGTYYEPFLGTGAVYLHLLPKKAVLNDLNSDMINIWKLVKTNPELIIKEIEKFKKTFLPKSNQMKLIQCKDIVSKMDTYSGDQRTINYLIMIYCSFNAIIEKRFSSLLTDLHTNNRCHIFTNSYVFKISELCKILKNIKIENKDYKLVLKTTKKGDFVFLDPPYIEDKNYDFEYVDGEFNIIELLKEVRKLDKKKVTWMMTQIDTKQVRDLFNKYKFYDYSNKQSIGPHDSIKKEVVITNY
jgi:DNA adenine methylase